MYNNRIIYFDVIIREVGYVINPKSKYYKIQNPIKKKIFFVIFEFWISFVVFVILRQILKTNCLALKNPLAFSKLVVFGFTCSYIII